MNVLENLLRDPITRINCQRIASFANWVLGACCSQHTVYADSRLQISPWIPRKIIRFGLAPIYTAIHLVIFSEKIYKCVEGWSGPGAFCHVMLYEPPRKRCPLHIQILPEIQQKCMAVSTSFIPWSMIFFGSSGWIWKSRISIFIVDTYNQYTGYHLAINPCSRTP